MSSYRISPSQINVFLTEPSIWLMNKFMGVYGEMGSMAKRGNMVELAVDMVCMSGLSIEKATERALELYDKETENLSCDKIEKNRENLPAYIKQAVECFGGIQEQIVRNQVRFEGYIGNIPAVGVADYDFGSYCMDLKTTERCPSSAETISVEHLRQVTFYYMQTKLPQRLAYVTPKKHVIYEVSVKQMLHAQQEMVAAARAMECAFSIEESQGIDALATLYPPRDTKGFYWNQETLNKAQDIWFH